MAKNILKYLIVTPIFALGGALFVPGTTTEYDWDNFNFSGEYHADILDSFVNSFPESEKVNSIKPTSLSPNSTLINLKVLFTPQAPLAEWSDPRQQDGCEEASVLMAMSYVGLDSFSTADEAKEKLLSMSAWQEENYGTYVDTSAKDTNERLLKGYYNYNEAKVLDDVDINDIKKELWLGNIVLAPCDGRKLGNPNFTAPGPERHMVLIRGYDEESQEFITNDPGTRKGEAYRYDEEVLYNAIRDYPTGDRVPIISIEKNIIVIGK